MNSNSKSTWTQISPQINRVISWGAGDQCKVNMPILRSMNVEIVAFIDEKKYMLSPIKSVPLFSSLADFTKTFPLDKRMHLGSVIAIGNPFGVKRTQYTELLEKLGINALSFADPTSRIRDDVLFGKGLQVMPGATVCNNVRIGNNCIINTNALVEHDCILMDATEIGPGAILTGRVTVNANAWIGAGAVVLPRLTIGKNSIVGAGAVVTKDVPENVVVVGSPARILRNL